MAGTGLQHGVPPPENAERLNSLSAQQKGLYLLVDSTGIKMLGEGEWKRKKHGARVRNETLRATRHLGRTIWKKWSCYLRRSLVETKMRCFKLLAERVMARDFDRQVAELQVQAARLNRFTQLGAPVMVLVA